MLLALRSSTRSYLGNLLAVVGGSLFIALAAQIEIPLLFSPVPLTLQTFAVLLVGGVLGSKRGMCAVLTYLAEASLGFPFLAGGGGGIVTLLGPTGGYVVGFIFAAYLAGSQKRLHLALATAVIWLCGSLWLSHLVGGMKNALLLGIVPFVAGDILKCLFAHIILHWRRERNPSL